jgi:5'-nucleotidase
VLPNNNEETKTAELIGQEVILSVARPLSCSEPALGPQTVLTVNPQSWEARLERAVQAGAEHIFCVFDFDRTVTTSFLEDGRSSLCSHDILGSIPKITTACKEEMDRVSDLYYPIEVDPNLTRDEKIPHMEKWYSHTNSCLGSQNITRGDMIKAVADCGQFRLRPGVQEAFQILHNKNIPVIILSAGVGNVIEEVVTQCIEKPNGCLGEAWSNVHVLSNNMLWGDEGQFVEFSEPLIHMFNKSLQDAPHTLREVLKGRDIGVLCGDGLGDLTMATGVETTDVLKFGFLNEKIDARLPKYAADEGFDRIILHDSHWGAILDDVLRKL